MTDDRRPHDDDAPDAPLDAGTGPDEAEPTPDAPPSDSPVLGEDGEERFDAG